MVVNGDEYMPPDGWKKVEIPIFGENPGITVWANHFKSGSERLDALMKDPRRFLTGQDMSDLYEGLKGEAIEVVKETTRVSTWITNHENSLLRMVLYATAIVSTEEDSCYLTLWKHKPNEP